MWVTVYTVPAGQTLLLRTISAINTSAGALSWILGINSGDQVARNSSLAASGVDLLDTWLIFEELEALQLEISAGSLKYSLHGQLLTNA